MSVTQTGVAIEHCSICELVHPVTRSHCSSCARPSLFLDESALCLLCRM